MISVLKSIPAWHIATGLMLFWLGMGLGGYLTTSEMRAALIKAESKPPVVKVKEIRTYYRKGCKK